MFKKFLIAAFLLVLVFAADLNTQICSEEGENCVGTECCVKEGLTCWEKEKDVWAGCAASCDELKLPGEEWTCVALG